VKKPIKPCSKLVKIFCACPRQWPVWCVRIPKVKETIRHQTPLLTRSPNCEAAGDIEKVAQNAYKEMLEEAKTLIKAGRG